MPTANSILMKAATERKKLRRKKTLTYPEELALANGLPLEMVERILRSKKRDEHQRTAATAVRSDGAARRRS